jgi:hypothetical protein
MLDNCPAHQVYLDRNLGMAAIPTSFENGNSTNSRLVETLNIFLDIFIKQRYGNYDLPAKASAIRSNGEYVLTSGWISA